MSLITELFFSEESVNRMARDAPLVFISVVATILASSYLNAGSEIQLNFGFILNLAGIFILSFLIVFALILGYSIMALLIRKL